MKLIIGCEESQIVAIEFRRLGLEAYSCDILPCSGGHPEWHIQSDLLSVIISNHTIKTQDGVLHYIDKWDALIAFPPCTYMSKAGARWMFPRAGVLCENRYKEAMIAKHFFLSLLNSDIEHISLENPFPLKVVGLPKETQTIQPYQFGDPFSKKTLLWLIGLPPLIHTQILSEYEPFIKSNTGGKKRGQKFRYNSLSQKDSSKTFKGIAMAMADQWSKILTAS